MLAPLRIRVFSAIQVAALRAGKNRRRSLAKLLNPGSVASAQAALVLSFLARNIQRKLRYGRSRLWFALFMWFLALLALLLSALPPQAAQTLARAVSFGGVFWINSIVRTASDLGRRGTSARIVARRSSVFLPLLTARSFDALIPLS